LNDCGMLNDEATKALEPETGFVFHYSCPGSA
jgi:hypothetical protein